MIPKRDGDGSWRATGIVIPWFDGERLALAKIRQPAGRRPKYADAFRDRPGIYPGSDVIEPGKPMVSCEGELDCLLLAQALEDMATVVTLGSASNRPHSAILIRLLGATRWYVATDSDEAGDKAASWWPARAVRVRPPGPYKDWTEAAVAGVDLARWWRDRLAGIEAPELFNWPELLTWRWGDALGDPEPGIIIDKPDRGRLLAALKARVEDTEERKAIQDCG
jgi:hypothetical protein